MADAERIRVVLVDDHLILRTGLADMLRREPGIEIAAIAGSAEEALGILEQLPVDVLLTDLRMPKMHGDTLIAEIRKRYPKVGVGILTTYHSDEDVLRSVKAGAMAYLLKSASVDDILTAIRCMRAGKTWFTPEISQQLARRLLRVELSVREREILQLAANGLRNRDIGASLSISENTVRNHFVNLMEKLGTSRRTEAITIGIRQGLVLVDSDE